MVNIISVYRNIHSNFSAKRWSTLLIALEFSCITCQNNTNYTIRFICIDKLYSLSNTIMVTNEKNLSTQVLSKRYYFFTCCIETI